MKKLISILCLTAFISSGAFAAVVTNGNSNQNVSTYNATVTNTTSGINNKAGQNLSSNKGDVKITGNSSQQVNTQNGTVINSTSGINNTTKQNLSTNDGTPQ